MKKNANQKILFVLDTNIPMHDPTCLFRFKEHDIFIPMVVSEELDRHKIGLAEIARNARQANRFLDELIRGVSLSDIKEGIPLSRMQNSGTLAKECSGRLFFQTQTLVLDQQLPEGASLGENDNTILRVVLALKKSLPDKHIVLVTKDINMRIKAAMVEIRAEDYVNDQEVDDVDLLYRGVEELPLDFWDTHGKQVEHSTKHGRNFYNNVFGSLVPTWHPNQFLYLPDDNGNGTELIVREINGSVAALEEARNYRNPKNGIWGISAKNREQNFIFNALNDPSIDFVTILGTAGTGKTLLTLATGLHMVMESKIYNEIIMTRNTIPIGEDIGFLPGTEEEKMAPWMGALTDNLELLGNRGGHNEWEQGATKAMLMNRVKIRSLNFMRGRTFLNRYLIIDEAQNLTAKQMKTLITRAGPGTKIICIGNLSQIDTPYLTPTTSGLTYAVERFKKWEHSAHIILKRGERSRLADYANDNL